MHSDSCWLLWSSPCSSPYSTYFFPSEVRTDPLSYFSKRVLINMFLFPWHFPNPTVLVFFCLCLAVFFGVVSGIFRTATPFRGTSCGAPRDSYPEKWQPYVQECSRIVTMQGLSWSLCEFAHVFPNLFITFPVLLTIFSTDHNHLWFSGALYIFVIVGTLGYMFKVTPKPTPGGLYGSRTRTEVKSSLDI